MTTQGDITLGLVLFSVLLSPICPVLVWLLWWKVSQWCRHMQEEKIRDWVRR